ncbi:hypothetical protein ES702_01223 [subsurface metagenome]
MRTIDLSNAIILLYHGVTTERSTGVRNSSGKHMYIDDFKYQMKYIKENCNTLALRDLLQLLEDGKELPKRTVAVTFDDSFKNVFKNAYAILKKDNVPATLFITTGFVGTERIIWTDILELIIDNLDDEKTLYTHLEDLGCNKRFCLTTVEGKVEVLKKIKEFLKSVDEKTKDFFITRLINGYQDDVHAASLENYETLSWEDVRAMDEDPLIEIGSHTINHPILSRISLKEAETEIVSSKIKLQNELGHKVDLFSYPEGQESHYNESIIKLLKKNRFICGLSAI